MHKTITHSTVEVKQKHCNTLPSVLIQKLYSNKTFFFLLLLLFLYKNNNLANSAQREEEMESRREEELRAGPPHGCCHFTTPPCQEARDPFMSETLPVCWTCPPDLLRPIISCSSGSALGLLLCSFLTVGLEASVCLPQAAEVRAKNTFLPSGCELNPRMQL